MSAERFNPETPASNANQAQSETVPNFDVARAAKLGAEKKNRKRKKNRRKNRTEVSQPSEHAVEHAPSEKPREHEAPKTMEDGAVMLWQRPETESKSEKPDQPPTEPVSLIKTKKPKPEAPVARTEPEAEKPEVEPTLPVAQGQSEPIRYNQQPQLQHQGQESIPEPEPVPEPGPEPLPVTESQPLLQPAAERPYEMPVPPAMPPDPISYRRRFWDEQPVQAQQEQSVNREALPPVHDYEQSAVLTAQQFETPAPVPGQARYESDTPPGLQRTTADVSRAAWTGFIAGTWLGRRGKRKAVERAQNEAQQQIADQTPTPASEHRPIPEQYRPPRLEAEPMHTYVPHQSPETGRKTVQPTSVETHAAYTPERPRPATTVEAAPEAVSSAGSERQLGKQELMKIAKDIKIDGVRLKDVYSAKRIDEEGLRAVVDAYLRGGDVKQQLTREIVVKEQSYERDPNLRHQRPASERDRKSTGAASEKIGKVLGQAKVIAGEQGAKLAASSQKTAKSASKVLASGAKQAQHDLIDNSNTADWLGITAVVVVWSIILILWLG